MRAEQRGLRSPRSVARIVCVLCSILSASRLSAVGDRDTQTEDALSERDSGCVHLKCNLLYSWQHNTIKYNSTQHYTTLNLFQIGSRVSQE